MGDDGPGGWMPMTGLDLESYLRLLRADLGVLLGAGAVILLMALTAWTSWDSRRVLRHCLALSIAVHVGLVYFGYKHPSLLLREFSTLTAAEPDRNQDEDRIREIRVIPRVEPPPEEESRSPDGRPGRRLADWDRSAEALELADRLLRPGRTPVVEAKSERTSVEAPAPEMTVADLAGPEPSAPESRPEQIRVEDAEPSHVPDAVEDTIAADPDVAEPEMPGTPSLPEDGRRVARREGPARGAEAAPGRADAPVIPPALAVESPLESATMELASREGPAMNAPAESGPGPGRESEAEAEPEVEPVGEETPALAAGLGSKVEEMATAEGEVARPDAEPRRVPRVRVGGPREALRVPSRPVPETEAVALADLAPSVGTVLPEPREPAGGRPLAEVPEVYRSRLDPNRSALAQRAGASAASEQAVERALVWLAKHQDRDGRWDGKAARRADGTPVPGDDDFTVHCPTGDPCSGECFYWEADTALTGLALLAYLGAGYTHREGPHAATVARGLNFLVHAQKADGDLRGESRAVGMYCHAMASLALCEAYALTGDPRLKDPAGRAMTFLVKAQAPDGRGWRYSPRAPMGDTSILGWAVLVLKSAGYGGLVVPPEAEAGAVLWLDRVAEGPEGGLGAYQPGQKPKASMTAEAWACRLFLGAGGRGADGAEASAYLMARRPDRETPFNLYYWYYGTLAMYLHGGPDWPKWNVAVRDELVRRQQTRGHLAGSWDPDGSPEGDRGGRLYSTALGALTLEVYYRYLRVYGDAPPGSGPSPETGSGRPSGVPPAGRGWRKPEKGLNGEATVR